MLCHCFVRVRVRVRVTKQGQDRGQTFVWSKMEPDKIKVRERSSRLTQWWTGLGFLSGPGSGFWSGVTLISTALQMWH